MVQVIQRQEDQRPRGFFENLMAGTASSLPKGLQNFAKNLQSGRVSKKKEFAGAFKAVKDRSSIYPKGSLSPEDVGNIENRALDLINQGYSKESAARLAYAEALSQQQDQNQPSESFASKIGIKPFGQGSISQDLGLEGVGGDVGKGILKGVRPIIEHGVGNSPTNPSFFADLFTQRQPTRLKEFDILTQNQGLPENTAERIISRYPLGGVGIGGAAGREIAAGLGLPEGAQEAADIIGSLVGGSFRLPQAARNSLESLLNQVRTIGQKTGQAPETVLNEAQQRSGADLSKISEGNVGEIEKLKNSITEPPEVAQRVTETPKTIFNPKRAMREREIFGARLPESPLDKYFKPEKQSTPTAETIAKRAETEARLRPLEQKKWNELNNLRSELRKFQAARRGATPEGLERINTNIGSIRDRSIPQVVEQIKDIQYELKYGRPRPTEAEIDSAIQKSVNEFVEEAHNPTVEGRKKIERQLQLDKEYIDQAQKLLDRGELPGEIRPDTFLKMKKKYLEGYKENIAQLRSEISELRGSREAADLKKIADNRKAIEFLEGRNRRLQADLVNQSDKIKAMRVLEKPSGAFYKQQLKGLRQDIADFQKDFFKQHRVKSPTEMKVEKTVKESFRQGQNLGKEISKNPTPENVARVSEKPSETIEAMKEVKQFGKKIENGTVKEADIVKTSDYFSKWSRRIKDLPKAFAQGVALGVLEYGLEEATGEKIPPSYLAVLVPGRLTRRIGAAFVASKIYNTLSGYTEEKEVERVSALPLGERLKEVQKWNERFPEKKRKRLLKKLSK